MRVISEEKEDVAERLRDMERRKISGMRPVWRE